MGYLELLLGALAALAPLLSVFAASWHENGPERKRKRLRRNLNEIDQAILRGSDLELSALLSRMYDQARARTRRP